MTFWLALALIWLGLAGFLLLAINRYRDHLEGSVEETPVGRIQKNGLIRYKKERPL